MGGKGDFQNQDSPLTLPKFSGGNAHIFGVFDGHGEHGKEISGFVRHQLPTMLMNDSAFPRKPQIALRNAAAAVNSKMKNGMIAADHSGSTGCVCFITGNEIITANTGDSRAIVGIQNGSRGTRPLQITEDHTAKNPKERSRILAHGGKIVGERIYCADSDEPGLIPSRAYGDFSGTPAGITCNPDIDSHVIGNETKWLAIMSDGVWENVPSSRIAQLIVSSQSLKSAAMEIVQEARRVIISGKRYRDDMTAVLVQFHNYGVQSEKSTKSRKSSSPGGSLGSFDDDDISQEEMVLQSVQVCREAMEQGLHEDDVLDILVGLTEETRQKVKNVLKGEPPAVASKCETNAAITEVTNKGSQKASRRTSQTTEVKRAETVQNPKKIFRRRTLHTE